MVFVIFDSKIGFILNKFAVFYLTPFLPPLQVKYKDEVLRPEAVKLFNSLTHK